MRIRRQITAFILVSFLLNLTPVALVFFIGGSIIRLQGLEVDIAETKASMFRLSDLIRSVMVKPGYSVAALSTQLGEARRDFHQKLMRIDDRLPSNRSAASFERAVTIVRRLWSESERSVLQIEGILDELSRNGFESRRSLEVSIIDYNSLLRTSEVLQNRDHYLIVRARNIIDSVILEADTYGHILIEASDAVETVVRRTIRLLTVMVALSVAGFGGGALFFGLRFSRESMVRRIDSLLDDVMEKEREKREFQIKALRYQMNPHFLFNTLNTVRHTCVAEGASESAEMIRILSRLLRNRLSSDNSLTTIRAEIDNLLDYMSLMQKRYNDRIDFRVSCSEDIEQWRIPRFLIQPLLENAILHGLRDRINVDNEQAELFVRFVPNESILEVTVSDNGVGMSRTSVSRLLSELPDRASDHIGVKSIHDMLSIAYGPPCGLSISSKPARGTDVTIALPININDGEQE